MLKVEIVAGGLGTEKSFFLGGRAGDRTQKRLGGVSLSGDGEGVKLGPAPGKARCEQAWHVPPPFRSECGRLPVPGAVLTLCGAGGSRVVFPKLYRVLGVRPAACWSQGFLEQRACRIPASLSAARGCDQMGRPRVQAAATCCHWRDGAVRPPRSETAAHAPSAPAALGSSREVAVARQVVAAASGPPVASSVSPSCSWPFPALPGPCGSRSSLGPGLDGATPWGTPSSVTSPG